MSDFDVEGMALPDQQGAGGAGIDKTKRNRAKAAKASRRINRKKRK